MNPTLLLLTLWSIRGRIIRMARRLKSPRYLIGLLVGVTWIGIWVVPSLFRGRGVNVQFGLPDKVLAALAGPIGDGVQLLVSLLLTLVVTLWWLVPFGRRSLEFTEPELNLLLPAPLPRRQLIQYSVLKSQPGILAGTFFASMMSARVGGAGAISLRWLGLWVIFTIWDLHSRGRGLWLARLGELPAGAAWRRRGALWIGLLALWIGLIGGAAALAAAMLATPLPQGEPVELGRELLTAWVPTIKDSLLGWLLTPMVWLTQPFFVGFHAPGLLSTLGAWVFPVAVLLIHNEWVVGSQVRFEEAAMAHAQRQSRQRDPSARIWSRPQWWRRHHPFTLAPTGPPEVAILWKNLMQATRTPWYYALAAATGLVLLMLAYLGSGLAPAWNAGIVLVAALWMSVISPLMSARALRYDLRCDLLKLELLRPWPLPGWRVFLAEIGAPAVLAVAQVLLLMTLGVGTQLLVVSGRVQLGWASGHDIAQALGLAPALLAPVVALAVLPVSLVLIGLTASIENLAALLFPGWVHLGPRKRQAAARFGQDLIVFFVLSLAILVGMAPGAILVAVIVLIQVWFWGIPIAGWELPLLGMAAAIPVGAVVAGLVMAGGGLWERLDPSEELLAGGGS